MIRSARQLKDKIRNLASDKAADAQILLRNYMIIPFATSDGSSMGKINETLVSSYKGVTLL